MKRRLLSLLLTVALCLTLLPAAALAAETEPGDGETTTPVGHIVMSFEMYDPSEQTVVLLKGPTKMGFFAGDTGTAIAKRMLGEANVDVSDSGWITSFTIDEVTYNAAMANESFNTTCGSWSVYKNNAEDGVTIGSYAPTDGDVYRVILTAYDSTDYSFPVMPHNLDALYWAMAEYTGDLASANTFVQGATPTQEAIDAKVVELSNAGGEHRIHIDQKTVIVDKSAYPYTYTPTLSVDKTTAASGETITVTATLPGGYAIKEGTLKANGVALTPVENQDNQYSFTMPDAHVTLTAELEILAAAKLDGAVFSYDENGTDVISMSPAFSSDTTEYALTLYDYKLSEDGSKVYSNLTFGATASASWQYYMVYSGSGFYTPGPNASQTVSGTTYGHSKANVVSPGMTNNQKHKVDVTATDGAPNAYFFRMTMLPTLSDLKIGEATVENFSPDCLTYAVSVPEGTEKIAITATPFDESSYYVYFEGNTKDDDISATSTEVTLNQGGTTTIKLVVDDDGGVTTTYTITVGEEITDETVLHAIAAKYAANGIASDGNAPWLAGDMAAYAKAFPDTENKLSDAQKQAYLDKLIPTAAAAAKPGDLAKYIIAFRAMGYDARKVVTADGTTVDLVKKLTDLVDDSTNTAVTNQYTLPYVIIALRQGKDYATQAQMDYLVSAAVSSKASWQSTSWGTDGVTPMMMALAPYSAKSDVKTALDEAVTAVKGVQNAENGSVGNANSTGLALAAFAALGTDAATVKAENSDKSLLDGLMSQVSDTKDGFIYGSDTASNAAATEQGFRGLVAQALMKQKNGPAQLYDFADMPMETARMTAANCPVQFNVVPADATVEVKLADAVQTAASSNYYDLAAGSYTYTVSKSGYRDSTGTIEVTADDASNHTKKDISVSLISQPSGGDDPAKELTITVKVLTHDANACGGKWTYKANADEYTTVIADQTVTVTSGQTAFDAFAMAMEAANVSYTEKTSGYISEIGGHEELGHGSSKSGWQYMIGTKLPDVGCREYTLTSSVTMTWFYTDDYTQEKGFEQWSGGSTSGGSSSSTPTAQPKVEVTTDKTTGETTAAVELPKGAESASVSIPAKDIAPNVELTGGNVLVIVDKDGNETVVKKSVVDGETVKAILNGSCTVKVVDNTKEFADTDTHWAKDSIAFAAAHELFQGTGDKEFSPDLPMDRAMLATVLYRLEDAAAQGENPFDDVAQDAWYTDAVVWANAEKIVTGTGDGFAPDRPITRQEIVTMLYRYAQAVGLDTKKTADLKGYNDADAVASWAGDAMEWAVAVGLVKGKTDTTLEPETTATRAEVATLMERMVKLLVG